jgi:sugar lactone lactonase YvrE
MTLRRGLHLPLAIVVTALLSVSGWLVLSGAAEGQSRARFDTRVLAHIPSPGFGALSLVAPDRTIYVGSFENPAGDSLPSKVFAFAPDGALRHTYTITGQNLSQPHGVQVTGIDANGLLYLMDQSPPRVLTLDPATGRQIVYATFHDLPPCPPPTPGSECSQTIQDNAPEPDYSAWAPDGSMYVTDYQEGTIWRVPPGGGTAHVWFTDPRLDGTMFGPAGIILMPDQHTLMFDTAASAPSTGSDFTQGKLFELPIDADGKPGVLRQLWESKQTEAPDGFALARSGNVYIALVGPNANQIVEVAPDGTEVARFPDPASNAAMPVPYDEPSSVQFDGERMIVTNLSYFQGNSAHQVLFDVWAGEPGAPIYQPPPAVTPGPPGFVSGQRAASQAVPRIRLSATPHGLRVGHRLRLRVHAWITRGRRVISLAGVRVRVAGQTVRTGRRGRATLALRPRRAGRLRVRASRRGYRSSALSLRVRT